jgi:hypothetical protein
VGSTQDLGVCQIFLKEEFKQWIIGDGGVKLSLFTLNV